MAICEVDYLRWAKTLPPCAYRLTDSGVPTVGIEDVGVDLNELDIRHHSIYGLPELVSRLGQIYGVAEECVLPLQGTSGANFVALACAFERGDRVLMEWPIYQPLWRIGQFLELDMVKLQRDLHRGFAFPLDWAAAELRQGAKGVVISNLHNPSGLRCTEQDLQTLAELTRETSGALIVDEVYLDFATRCRGEAGWTAAQLGPHVITTSSLTKVYGLGPIRAGWMMASPAMIRRAQDLTDHLHVNNPMPSEFLAVHALRNLDRLTTRTRNIFERSYPILRDWLATRTDLHHYGNDGAIICYLRVDPAVDTRVLCKMLLEEYDTLIVPGHFFETPDHVRISFGVDPSILAEGLGRVGEALDRCRE